MDTLFQFPQLTKVLTDYAQYLRETYKANLEKSGHKATGNLISSIQTNVVIGENTFAVDMSLASYYKWVNEGRKKGGRPPISSILEWIQVKPILPTGEKYEKLPTEKAQLSLAFAIANAIAENGSPIRDSLPQEPTFDFTRAVDQTNSSYMLMIEEALTNDLAAMGSKLISLVINNTGIDQLL